MRRIQSRLVFAAVATGVAAMFTAAIASATLVDARNERASSSTLTVVHSSEPRSLNPMNDAVKSSITISSAILDPIISVDAKFRPSPGLATSWRQLNKHTWQINLRKGVAFSNGERFDAKAAAFSIITTRDTPSALQPYFKPVIRAVRIKDPYTLIIRTRVPTSIMPELLTLLYALPPTYYKEDPKRFDSQPIGTGPFKLDQWQPGQSITVSRNARYWGQAPKLDSIVWRIVPDPQTAIALLTQGAVDFIEGFPAELLPNVEGQPGVHVVKVRDLRKAFIEVNTHVKPFSDKRAREALAHAIDRNAIVKTIFNGLATPTTAILTSNFASAISYRQTFKYDPKKSAAILKKMGKVVPVEFYGPVGRYPNDKLVGEAIVGMLKNVGFDVRPHFMEPGAWVDLLLTNNAAGAHFLTIAPLYPAEDMIMRVNFATDGVFQYCGTPALDKQMKRAITLSNPAVRTQAYKRIATFIANGNGCWVPIYDFVQLYGVSDRVSGLKLYPHGFISYTGVSVR